MNQNLDPIDFFQKAPLERVAQIHLAGHTLKDGYLLDNHEGEVIEPVWELYKKTLEKIGYKVPTCIEWDEDTPHLNTMRKDIEKAERVLSAFEVKKRKAQNDSLKKLSFKESENPPQHLFQTQKFITESLSRAAFDPQEGGKILTPLPEKTLEICFKAYQRNYLVTLKSSLEDTFSACKTLLEEELFSKLAYRFIIENPSRNTLLSAYGFTFPEFLGSQKFLKDLVFLEDLARLEWFLKEGLLSFPQEGDGKTFYLHTHHPVHKIWEALNSKQNFKPEEPPKNNYHLILKSQRGPYQEKRILIEESEEPFLSQRTLKETNPETHL